MDTRLMLIELYETNWLRKQCLYITKDINNCDFVMSEVMIKIIERDDVKLLKLYYLGDHYKYIYTMIKNEYTGKYSNTGKYIKNSREVEFKINTKDDEEKE